MDQTVGYLIDGSVSAQHQNQVRALRHGLAGELRGVAGRIGWKNCAASAPHGRAPQWYVEECAPGFRRILPAKGL